MIVFLDTNILVDFVTGRDGSDDAARILGLTNHDDIKITTSFLSMANTAYVVRKGHTQAQIYDILTQLNELVEVLDMNKRQLAHALKHQVSDFEDMLQYACAKEHGCDLIITRNKRDFSFSDIPIYTPTQYLQMSF